MRTFVIEEHLAKKLFSRSLFLGAFLNVSKIFGPQKLSRLQFLYWHHLNSYS